MAKHVKKTAMPQLPQGVDSSIFREVERLLESTGRERVYKIREKMQGSMMDNCSVFREKKGLGRALNEIQRLRGKYMKLGLTYKGREFNYELQEALELGNMLKTAEVVVLSALKREESRGAHYRKDFPKRNDESWLKHTLISKTSEGFKLRYRDVTIKSFRPRTRRY